MTIYEENILILDGRFPALAKRLEGVTERDNTFQIVQAKSEAHTVKIISEKKSEQFLHSFYDPLREGDTIAAQIKPTDADLFFIIGFGLGYHVQSLLRQLKPVQKVLVIEPCPMLFKQAVCVRNFCHEFNNNQLCLIVEANKLGITHAIKVFLNNIIPYNTQTIKVAYAPFYERWDRFAPFCHEVKICIQDTIDDLRTMRKEVVEEIDYLRTSGLGKTFFGDYKKCLTTFRQKIKAGQPLSRPALGMLSTYYLFSHYSYAETFEKGSADEA